MAPRCFCLILLFHSPGIKHCRSPRSLIRSPCSSTARQQGLLPTPTCLFFSHLTRQSSGHTLAMYALWLKKKIQAMLSRNASLDLVEFGTLIKGTTEKVLMILSLIHIFVDNSRFVLLFYISVRTTTFHNLCSRNKSVKCYLDVLHINK